MLAFSVRQDECRPGASAWACLWLVALLRVRGSWSACVFRAVYRCMLFGGDVLLPARIPSSLSFTVLACGTSGSGRGSWLLQVLANLVALRVLLMLLNGVSVLGSRWGGQPARFALALQVAVVFV